MWFQKKSIPHRRGSLEILRGTGVLKAQIFKGMYEPKLELPAGWGVQTKKTPVGGVWIFCATTHSCSTYSRSLQLSVV